MTSGAIESEFVAFHLENSKAVCERGITLPSQFIHYPEDQLVRVGQFLWRCVAPSDAEMLWYDRLYDDIGKLVGIELRMQDDAFLDQFAAETSGFDYITYKSVGGWRGFPRVWFVDKRSGSPRPESTELFGDIFVCRRDDRKWIILVPSSVFSDVCDSKPSLDHGNQM